MAILLNLVKSNQGRPSSITRQRSGSSSSGVLYVSGVDGQPRVHDLKHLRPCPHDTFPNWARSIATTDRDQFAPSCPCPYGGNWNARSVY